MPASGASRESRAPVESRIDPSTLTRCRSLSLRGFGRAAAGAGGRISPCFAALDRVAVHGAQQVEGGVDRAGTSSLGPERAHEALDVVALKVTQEVLA